MARFIKTFGIGIMISLLSGCSPSKEMNTESISAVQQFDLQRYLGTWYEIGRLPHSFENGLDKVTATYTLRDDGMIGVLNRGFSSSKQKWSEASGKARLKPGAKGAYLEVSFFWIFYADYKVIELDTNYTYAMITSSSKEYLWVLCRTPKLDETIYSNLLRKAGNLGFNTNDIYKVQQE
jgi:apolipoprotein D and lipocalin family protein